MQHLAKIKQLKKTLAFQQDIQVFRQIPKRYRPSATLETPFESQSPLTTDFQHEFEKLFFDHLSKVITFNTISLELELARLRHSGRFSDCTLPTIPPQKDTNQPHCSQSTLEGPPTHTSETLADQTSKTQRGKRRRCNRNPGLPKKRCKFSEPTASTSNTTKSTTTEVLQTQQPELIVHNYSTYMLSSDEISLLHKGLSFSPTQTCSLPELRSQMLKYFYEFAKSLRLKYNRAQYRNKKRQTVTPPPLTTTATIYRQMKFLPPTKPDTVVTRFSGFGQLENYIDNTKQNIVDNLDKIAHTSKFNLTVTQKTAMQQLKKVRHTVIIKPADKNLGVVLMNTDDYVTQCLAHLTDHKTYRLITGYPAHGIRQQLLDTLANYKQVLGSHDKRLYKYLCEPTNDTRVPRFYGIPKIHKEFTKFPPLRPIVSQTLSLLSPSAKFIDYVLQPIARSYPDYLHDSSTLSVTLQDSR